MQLKKKNRVLVRQGDRVETLEIELSEEASVEAVRDFIENMGLDFLGLEESLFNNG